MQPRRDRVSCGQQALGDPQRVLAVALQAYVATNGQGCVVAWNQAAETTFGYRFEQACGQDVADLIVAPPLRQAHRQRLADLAANRAGRSGQQVGQRLELTARHRDGHEFPIDVMLTVTDEPTGKVIHAFIQDVTTAQRVRRFTAVEAAVSRGLAEAASSREAAARVVEALSVRMHWPVAELWLADEPRQMIRCVARHTSKGLRLGPFAITELEPGVGLPGRVYQTTTANWIPDLAADTTSFRSRAAARAGLHVAIGVPIFSGGHALGALCVYGDRIEDPEDTVSALLGGLAAQVGQYLERRRAEELTIELAKTKDEFLALVTHELRNPLAVITAATLLLEEEIAEACPEHIDQLRTIIRNTQRLTLITEDLLDLAHLESGHLAINPCGTDLRAIIDESMNDLTSSAQEKHLAVTVRGPEHVELHADPHRLRQVADNLLSNAIKYTPAGGSITITADTDGDDVLWTVTDTGIGIPAADRPHLFRRFYRASTALERRIPGSGLGLVITRTIIERHRGTIVVADGTGTGTTFQVRLPRKPEPDRRIG